MAHSTPQGANLLKGWMKVKRFEKGLSAELPEAYRKFFREWKSTPATAVHYIPKEGRFERNEITGVVLPVQNVKIPLKKVPEEDEGIWGGEAIIKGFQKRNPYKRRVPHYWVPTLKRSVVRSEVLNEYFSMTVTDRTIRLIMENHGFDHYLLKTLACDLRSLLALKLKQRILQNLHDGCPAWQENPKRQKEIKSEYDQYLQSYTSEEIEWYGLSWIEALKKIKEKIDAEKVIVPHKIIFRQQLIDQLREAGIKEAGGDDGPKEPTSWTKKLNPFAKKEV